MEEIALYLRAPFYNSMEQVVECWYSKKTGYERALEYAGVYLHFVTWPLTLSFLADAIIFDQILDQFNTLRYTYLEGKGKEKSKVESLISWNVCMLFGGLSVPYGGEAPARMRIPDVATKILETSADLVCLQEVSQDAAYALYEKLKGEYKYFYFKINPDPILSLDSSLFIASKVPLKDAKMVPIPQGGRIQRAAFSFKANDCTFIVTHLQPGGAVEDFAFRRAQAQAILDAERDGKRVLIGDLNMEREEFLSSPFASIFYDSLPEQEGATSTDYFTHQVRPFIPPGDCNIDYIAGTPGVELDVKLYRTYDKERNHTISDHHILYARIKTDQE